MELEVAIVLFVIAGGGMHSLLHAFKTIFQNPETLYGRIHFALYFSVAVMLFLAFGSLGGIRVHALFEYSFMVALFVIAPAQYVLVLSSVNPDYTFRFKQWLLFAPAVLAYGVIIYFTFASAPFDRHPLDYLRGGEPHALDAVFLFCLAYAAFIFSIILKKGLPIFELKQSRNVAPVVIYVAYFSALVFEVTLCVIAILIKNEMLIYIIAMLIAIQVITYRILENWRFPLLFQQLSVAIERASYKKSKLGDVDIEALDEQINTLMEREMLYTNENLNVATLAEMLDLKHYQLREYLNVHRNTNFPHFVNAYRVEEAAKLLTSKGGDVSILSVAFKVGFNSKANFNHAFRKIIGCSPTEYIARHGLE